MISKAADDQRHSSTSNYESKGKKLIQEINARIATILGEREKSCRSLRRVLSTTLAQTLLHPAAFTRLRKGRETTSRLRQLTFLLGLSGEELGGRIPSEGHLRVHTAVEGLQAGPLRALLLTKLIRSIAEHDSFVVANGCLRPIATSITSSETSVSFRHTYMSF